MELEGYLKLMRLYGVVRLKTAEVEIEMGMVQPDQLRLADLENLDLGEDDPGFELSFKEKRAIQERMKELRVQQERQDIYGAG